MEIMLTDIPRAYTAAAEWSACIAYLLAAGNIKRHCKNICFCGGFLVFQTVYMVVTGNAELMFWIPCMAGAVLMMFLFLHSMLSIDFRKTIFICAKAFLTAEFAASVEWQIHVQVFSDENRVYAPEQVLPAIFIYGIVFSSVAFLEQKRNIKEFIENISWKDSLTAVLIAGISFAVSNLNFVISPMPYVEGVQNYIFMIRTLVDLCGIAVMFVQQSRIQEVIAERELAAGRIAWKGQYEQYRNFQDSFELINRKYHDLKHQIAGLRAEPDAEKRNVWLNELEQELDVLSDIGHTGNNVLDGILAAKMVYCRRNHIKVTCVADGEILKGIHVTDLCTIFGNALDNAVECVSLLEDAAKRLIHFSVTKEKDFIFIRFENYCEHELEIGSNTLPVTSKADKKEHGYGMKSIRIAAEKYQGSMAYELKNNWFELKILIPSVE